MTIRVSQEPVQISLMRKIQVFFASLFYRIFNPALADLIVAIKKSDSDGVEGLCRRITSYTGDQTKEITRALCDVTQVDMKDRINSILVEYKFLGPIGATETDKTSTATPPGQHSSQAVPVIPGRAQPVSPPQPPTLVELAQQGNVGELRAPAPATTPIVVQKQEPTLIELSQDNKANEFKALLIQKEAGKERIERHVCQAILEHAFTHASIDILNATLQYAQRREYEFDNVKNFKNAVRINWVDGICHFFDKISDKQYREVDREIVSLLSHTVQNEAADHLSIRCLTALNSCLNAQERVAVMNQNHTKLHEMLMRAIAKHNQNAVQEMIRFGLSPNMKVGNKTAMMLAIQVNKPEIFKYLHIHGKGQINTQTELEENLLHLSLTLGSFEIAKYLMRIKEFRDGHLNQFNEEGNTPLDCLERSEGTESLRALMREYGAKTSYQIRHPLLSRFKDESK